MTGVKLHIDVTHVGFVKKTIWQMSQRSVAFASREKAKAFMPVAC